MEQFIQIGELTYRDPETGAFEDTHGIYVIADDALTDGRDSLLRKASTLFSEGFIEWARGAGVKGAVV